MEQRWTLICKTSGTLFSHKITFLSRKFSQLQYWMVSMPFWSSLKLLKPPLHRAATFVPPLSDQKIYQVAQWSPQPRKFCLCVTAAARPLCVPWTTKTAVVAQQVVQRRQSGGRTIAMVVQGSPWSPNGGTVVATVIAQWTLFVGQRRHSGGTREAEASLKLVRNVYNSTHYFTGWPMADHCASSMRPRRYVFLPPAFFERPVSDCPPRRPLFDCFEHAQNFMATMAWSESPLCHPWMTKATFWPPLYLQQRPGQFCGRTREAQRSQPLCKGGISWLLAASKLMLTLQSDIEGSLLLFFVVSSKSNPFLIDNHPRRSYSSKFSIHGFQLMESFHFFSREEDAQGAFQKFNGRFYAGRLLNCEFTVVTNWKHAICGKHRFKSKIQCRASKTFVLFVLCTEAKTGYFGSRQAVKGEESQYSLTEALCLFWVPPWSLHLSPVTNIHIIDKVLYCRMAFLSPIIENWLRKWYSTRE